MELDEAALPYHELISKIKEDGHKIAIVDESGQYQPPSTFEETVEYVDLERLVTGNYLAALIMGEELANLENIDVLQLVDSGTTVFFERASFSIEELIKWIEDKEIPEEMGEAD